MSSPDEDFPGFSVDVSVDPGGAVVAVSGEVDSYTGRHLKERLLEVVVNGAESVTLDLANVSFIDSSGLAVLVGVHRELKEAGGSLVLRAPSAATRKVLDITGLSSVIPIVD